ncbi:hypothetical protein [Novosphingobium sp.]|uniref:hypothetical protein n=1 Tax=Novosphingobium sp. TaxID=1874826 RepID=UPI00286A9B8C|nr:hypothetical protein [Novosphingobium sp.]
MTRDKYMEEATQIVRKMYAASGRARIEAQEIPLDRIDKAFAVAENETDRSVAILIFALAEDLMSEFLKFHLNPKAYGGFASAFSNQGVLATASDRIAILELLFWIRKETAQDLRILKSIRNLFAHHSEINSFSDDKIPSWLSSMQPLFTTTEDVILKKRTERSIFLLKSICTIFSLIYDLSVLPITFQEKTDPYQSLGKEWNELPDNIQAIFTRQAGILAYFRKL